MKGSIGVSTHLRYILPHQDRLAKITKPSPEGSKRLKWIDYYRKYNNVSLTCRHFGISRSLFYKWFNRFKHLGLRGLNNQSTKPNTVRQREIVWNVRNRIETLRRDNPAWSKYKISYLLKRDEGIIISPSSVNRIFHDRNLFWSSPISKSVRATKRNWKIRRIRAPKELRGSAPGSLVEIDVKVLNNFGATNYQFTAIDTCVKMKYIEIFSTKSAVCGQRFVEHMLNYFPFRVRHINSDNGGEFLSECHAYLEMRKITHYFSRARTPKDNPMVENTIKADEYEFWVWGNLSTTVQELNKKAKLWMEKFNTYRPHQALNYLTPMEYYEKILSR